MQNRDRIEHKNSDFNHNQSKKLLFFVTEDWYFCSHRLPLAIAAKQAGFDVLVVTRVRAHEGEIKQAGIRLICFELSRRGMNPFVEIKAIFKLFTIYNKEQPDIVHHVALKPVLYGSIASYFAQVSCVVNALAGLGFLFASDTLKARIIKPFILFLFKFLLNLKNSRVILQNPDDAKLLCNNHILKMNSISLIRGSGVDIRVFCVYPELVGVPIVILASRMIWEKGIGEFVEAAGILKQQNIIARFVLVGDSDSQNPSAIPEQQLIAWNTNGDIEWWGHQDDMPRVFAQSHIICLPSYREGVPKVLIEGAASGRPIVTTDAPGCREIVQDGQNGYLVPLRDSSSLAAGLKKLIENPQLRRTMGIRGRKLVEKEFSIEKVNYETIAVYKELLQ